MAQVLDYFFGPYITPQEQRLRAVARNGVQHASAITPADPLPGQPVQLAIWTDAALPIDRVAVYYTTDQSEPAGERGVARVGTVAPAQLALDAPEQLGEGTLTRRWSATLPGQPEGTLVRYRIDAWVSGEPARHWVADATDPFTTPAPAGREFAYHVDQRRAPAWIQDAIVYHIFVDRFAAASDQPPIRGPRDLQGLSDFSGGTIRGITEKLDYLSDLGVNCLWLSPVMESPTYHSYNPSSYHEVSKRFGSNADLRTLIAAAHARGMRVVLDFVANHTSSQHPAFVAAQGGAQAQEREWYIFGPRYRNGYLAFYDVSDMPVLRTDAAPVRSYLIEAARHWLNDFGADGLRLDNVSGPTHAFWTFFQEGVKAGNPNALTLGEVSGGMGDIAAYAGRLDSCMDFPLARLIRQMLGQRAAPLSELLAEIAAHDAQFPKSMTPARLLDNHDMHRFLWLAEGDTRQLKLALTLLMTLTGFPIVYYGTEVGLSQRDGPPGKDAFAREPMLWGAGQQRDVLEQARWLIRRRVERVSLRRGQMAQVSLAQVTGDAGQVGALARWSANETTIVVFNNGDTPAHCTLDPDALSHLPRAASAAEAWLLAPDGVTALAPSDSLTLPPRSALMLFR